MLIKPRARFLTSANNHVHQRLPSPIKQGGASFLSDISAVFFFYAPGWQGLGSCWWETDWCFDVRGITFLHYHKSYSSTSCKSLCFVTLRSTLEKEDSYCYRHLRCRTSVFPFLKGVGAHTNFPLNVSSTQSVKPQMKRLACGDSWPGPHITHSCRHHISQLMRSVGGFTHSHHRHCNTLADRAYSVYKNNPMTGFRAVVATQHNKKKVFLENPPQHLGFEQ